MGDLQPKTGNQFVNAYNKVWARLSNNLTDAEIKSWDLLQKQVEEAVEIELTAEQMTRDELDLIGAYVKRDLAQFGHYSHMASEGVAAFLKFDLNYLEKTALTALLGMADRTRIDQELLRERLEHADDEYIAGELATVGTLECLNCGMPHRLLETVVIEPCQKCAGQYFKRVSGPVPG